MADALLVNAAVLGVLMLVLWRLAVWIGDVSFIDAAWGGGMALLALTSWFLAGETGTRATMIAAMAVIAASRQSMRAMPPIMRTCQGASRPVSSEPSVALRRSFASAPRSSVLGVEVAPAERTSSLPRVCSIHRPARRRMRARTASRQDWVARAAAASTVSSAMVS